MIRKSIAPLRFCLSPKKGLTLNSGVPFAKPVLTSSVWRDCEFFMLPSPSPHCSTILSMPVIPNNIIILNMKIGFRLFSRIRRYPRMFLQVSTNEVIDVSKLFKGILHIVICRLSAPAKNTYAPVSGEIVRQNPNNGFCPKTWAPF